MAANSAIAFAPTFSRSLSLSTFTHKFPSNTSPHNTHFKSSSPRSNTYASISETEKNPPDSPQTASSQSSQQVFINDVPDAGLISKPGPTGTTCASLFPIPILGSYNWFLTVYKRDLAASKGPFCLDVFDPQTLRFSFLPDHSSSEPPNSNVAKFNGVAAGNLNVQNHLRKLNHSGPHRLLFFDRGSKENLFQRRNQLETLSKDCEDQDIWTDPAPTFQVTVRSSAFEIRDLYSSAGEKARNPSKFEYFAMNLFPIYPLQDYSAIVCVWHLRSQTSPVAIDKRQGSIRLSFFDPLEIPSDITPPPTAARFAIKAFNGGVTDTIVTEQHQTLLNALAAANITVSNKNDFRIVNESKPGQIAAKRRNEIWVQVD